MESDLVVFSLVLMHPLYSNIGCMSIGYSAPVPKPQKRTGAFIPSPQGDGMKAPVG